MGYETWFFFIYINKNIFLSTAKKLPKDVNKKGVFACNELDLKEINVYGFDYDYTLAVYKPAMDFLLYDLGRNILISKYKVSLNIAIWLFHYMFKFVVPLLPPL